MTDPQRPDLLASPPDDRDLSEDLNQSARRGTPRATLLLAGVALLAVGFVGGVLVHKSLGTPATGTRFPGTGQGQGGGRGFPGAAAGGATFGTVKQVDGSTVTIETPDGQTKKVTTTGGTEIRVLKEGTVGDLATGTQITVTGTERDDGTIEATAITSGLRGFGRGPAGGGANGGSGAAQAGGGSGG